ncbi:hypothetical protein NDU88_007830 [Pleurodeles waltl]|uniref:Uncharacterized protein n=1 Tax=Pleurodeles waltl TaxID=8319 RepID=A0AAV7VQT9_PLEWA|nr:hypothetical protein NDU88_007830 [Pleurodeles waltl]
MGVVTAVTSATVLSNECRIHGVSVAHVSTEDLEVGWKVAVSIALPSLVAEGKYDSSVVITAEDFFKLILFLAKNPIAPANETCRGPEARDGPDPTQPLYGSRGTRPGMDLLTELVPWPGPRGPIAWWKAESEIRCPGPRGATWAAPCAPGLRRLEEVRHCRPRLPQWA